MSLTMDYPRLWDEVFAPRATEPIIVGPPDYRLRREDIVLVVVGILAGPYRHHWTPALLEIRLGLEPYTIDTIDRMLAQRYPDYDGEEALA